jgi:hypothetical protein
MSQYIPLPPPIRNEASAYAFEELLDLARALQESNPFLLLQELNAAPDKPREGMIVLADGTNWDPGDGSGFYGYRDGGWRILDPVPVTYSAATVTPNTGSSPTGAVGDTAAIGGGAYGLTEAAGTPGFDIEFALASVVRKPTYLVIRAFYNGSLTHNVTVDLYRYTGTPGWDKLDEWQSSLDYVMKAIPLPPNMLTDYVSAGAAKVRFYHNSAGNPAHTMSIDYIGLTNK